MIDHSDDEPDLRSRLSAGGATLAVGYAALAAVLFGRAFTCTGWVCDLVALPAAVPVGFVVGPFLDGLDRVVGIPGYTPTFHFRSAWFIAPTVLGNLVVYYLVGAFGERFVRWSIGKLSSGDADGRGGPG